MVTTHIPGYPRIGARRELKFALESYWRGETDDSWLLGAAADLRAAHWRRQRDAGLSLVAAGDFSLYDPMLDLLVLLGCPPARFGFDPQQLTLRQYFELARGNTSQPALEMTKWFDTNYHYLVPELSPQTCFDGGPDWYFDHIGEALAAGHPVKPVLIGPVTFLRLAKAGDGFDRMDLLEPLSRAYARILGRLRAMGVEWVQIDEPVLCLELEPKWLDALDRAYAVIAAGAPRLLLTSYFDSIGENADRILGLPVQGIHLDLVRAPRQLGQWLAKLPQDWVLSAGVIDGRNIWRTDLRRTLDLLRPVHDALGDRLWIAPSCSLQHVPVSLSDEERLDAEIRPWLAFADEKLEELRVLGAALTHGAGAVRAELDEADASLRARRSNRRIVNEEVHARLGRLTAEDEKRTSPHVRRSELQQAHLKLPPLPTTTIGSFPQTARIRGIRAAWKRGETGELQYLEAMRGEIRDVIARQETLGLDVLVHGEAERNDMVEFFGEQLWGFCFTQNGWVQSYGSRCVKPPVIYGDVARPEPMTVNVALYAQSLTAKPVKGMLTGPVTILQWSFVRDDQPREQTALQIALAVREEVADLEKAGIRVIQIDEPALREGLPLKRSDWDGYLDWAVRAFRISAAAAADETQIHTHMCYAEFNDILPAIAAMDADVITIETSRSNMELLDGFGDFRYPNDVGPGVYDIHSPRIPQAEDMLCLLQRACRVIPPERLWINPDCGLKTRSWPEVEPALRNMVAAARRLREQLAGEGGAAATSA